ncbi:MAG: polysaccharide pyruvyl transferase family protein [Bryobacteraceae bacterium]
MDTANSKRIYRIGISGSYGGMNLGDEAILAAMIAEMRAAVPVDITVFSRYPQDTLSRHDVERAVPVRSLTQKEIRPEIARLDLLVLGGGGILFDRDAHAYLREVLLAHELGVTVMVYAISAGPLRDPSAREVVRAALNQAAVITVRDREGYRLLEDVGVSTEIHLTGDPALLLTQTALSKEAIEAEGVEFDRHLIGFSVREPGPAAPELDPEEYCSLLANAADFAIERLDSDVVFVAMERTDIQHAHGVVAHMYNADRVEILRKRYSSQQILDLLGRFEFAVGMRLHFLIFAALQGTPFVALPYASKVVGFLEDLQLETPPLGDFGVGQLIARIDRPGIGATKSAPPPNGSSRPCKTAHARPTACWSSSSGGATASSRKHSWSARQVGESGNRSGLVPKHSRHPVSQAQRHRGPAVC